MKIETVSNDPNLFVYHCPGGGYGHCIRTGPDVNGREGGWQFNMDFEKPTVTPSILVCGSMPERRCHSFITDGKIQFLDDCFHSLKGQTIDMIDMENT